MLYVLKMQFHIFFFTTDTLKAWNVDVGSWVQVYCMVSGGNWDQLNSYSALQARTFIMSPRLFLLEAWSNLNLVSIPRSRRCSQRASSPFWSSGSIRA